MIQSWGISRRCFVAGSATAAISLALSRHARALPRDVYREGIVIDGLGGLGNSSTEDGPLGDRFIQDVRESGLTCVHTTILPVGTTAPDTAFTQTVLGIGSLER